MTTTATTPTPTRMRETILEAWGDYGYNYIETPTWWAMDLPAANHDLDAVRVAVSFEDENVKVYGKDARDLVEWSATFSLSTPFAVIAATVHEAVGLDA